MQAAAASPVRSVLPSSLSDVSLLSRGDSRSAGNEENRENNDSLLPCEEGDEEDDVELISEEEIVRSCCNAIQGIESKLISWQSFEDLELDPFADKPVFDVLEQQDSDEEPDIEYQKELEELQAQQELENSILDQFCQLRKTKNTGALRITPQYRYGKSSLPSSQVELAEKICSTGSLYISIHKVTKDMEHQAGVILQSVLAFVRQYTKEFYQSLAKLEDSSLRSLFVWCLPFFRKFSHIALLLQEIRRTGSTGGQILSVLYKLTQHGNPDVRNDMEHALDAGKVPFYRMIQDWLFYGDTEDLYGEFFVAKVPNTSIDNLWHEMYTLRTSMVPNFIPVSLAQRILRIGKSIDFLRTCCKQEITTQDHSKSNENINSTSLRFLEKLVDYGERKYNKKAVDIMMEEFHLRKNFEAAKKFLFFEQGDFVQALLADISEELNQPAEKIFVHRLRSHLESALLSTGKCQSQQILRRIRVSFERKGTGWESFGLSFHTEAPLNMIFTPTIVTQYEKVSSFLWQLKRVEFTLIRNRQNHPLKSLRLKELYKFHVIHNHMLRFVNDLQFYLMNDSINSAWKVFMQKLKRASNLDRIYEAHQEYLQVILQCCLFSADLEPLMGLVMKICKAALDFKIFQNALYTEVQSFQLSMKSSLEPSLETFEITKRNSYRRCIKVVEQYQTYISQFCELVKHHKLPHLLSFAQTSALHL